MVTTTDCPQGSLMDWLDWILVGMLALAMGSLAVEALVMFAMALSG